MKLMVVCNCWPYELLVVFGLHFCSITHDWRHHKVGSDGRRHWCTGHIRKQNFAAPKRCVCVAEYNSVLQY